MTQRFHIRRVETVPDGEQTQDNEADISTLQGEMTAVEAEVDDLQERSVDVWDDWLVPLTATVTGGANPPVFGRFLNDSTVVAGASQHSGANGYQVADSTSLDITAAITVSAWVYYDTINSGGERVVVFKDDAYELRCGDKGKKPEFAIWTGSSREEVKVGNADKLEETDKWFHLVGTYDQVDLNLYIDGVLVKSVAQTGAIDASANDLFLGCEDATGTDGWEGRLDEVVILNRAITATEVLQLYNDGAGTYTSAGATGLVAGYHLDVVTAQVATDLSANSNDGAGVPVASEPTQEDGLILPGSKGIFAYKFEPGVDQELFFNTQLPHRWKVGTDLKPHYHAIFQGAATGDIKIGLEFITLAPGQEVPATTTTITKTSTLGATGRDRHAIVAFNDDITINTTTGNVSTMMMGRFYRMGSDAADTYLDDVILLEFDMHFIVDSDGSDEEYNKTIT